MHPDYQESWEEFPDDWYDGADEITLRARRQFLEKCLRIPPAPKDWFMLSTEYRKRLEGICAKIARGQEVQLSDMVWAQKLAKANRSALEMMNRARREALTPGDDFYNALGLGNVDPQQH